jgi:hypothetical protein
MSGAEQNNMASSCKSKAITMKKKDFVSEHKKLVKVLRTGKGRKREAEEQEKELKEKE